MAIRELSGMTYRSVELEHTIDTSPADVLRSIALWLEDNDSDYGILVDINTQCSPFNDDTFLTTLVWAP